MEQKNNLRKSKFSGGYTSILPMLLTAFASLFAFIFLAQSNLTSTPSPQCPASYMILGFEPKTVAAGANGTATMIIAGPGNPGGFAIYLSGVLNGNSNTQVWNNFNNNPCASKHSVDYTAGASSGKTEIRLNFLSAPIGVIDISVGNPAAPTPEQLQQEIKQIQDSAPKWIDVQGGDSRLLQPLGQALGDALAKGDIAAAKTAADKILALISKPPAVNFKALMARVQQKVADAQKKVPQWINEQGGDSHLLQPLGDAFSKAMSEQRLEDAEKSLDQILDLVSKPPAVNLKDVQKRVQDKIAKVQSQIGPWIQGGGDPQKIVPLTQSFGSAMVAGNLDHAEQALDQILAILAVAPSGSSGGAGSSRSYYMGLSLLLPPSSNPDVFIPKKLAFISNHADALLEHPDVPWKALLSGAAPDQLAKNLLATVNLARSKGLKIFIMLEPLNGLDRHAESPDLLAAGKSIKDAQVQKLYHDYVLAVARIVKPDYLGLAAEVNGVEALNKSGYSALVKMVSDTAKDLKKQNPSLPLYISVANEVVWGMVNGNKYVGIDDVFRDFPFIDALSFTSYPQLRWSTPEEVPDDYLTRPLSGHNIPVLIDEEGWPSNFSQGNITASPSDQARWIVKLGILAGSMHAILVGQLVTNDIEPQFQNPDVQFFTTQGLVDSNLNPKPALAEWDKLFKLSHTAPPPPPSAAGDCTPDKASSYVSQAIAKAQELGVALSGSKFLGCDERNTTNGQEQDTVPADLTGYDGIVFYNVIGTNAENTLNLPSKAGFMIYAPSGGGSHFDLNLKGQNSLVGIYTDLSNSVIAVTGAPEVTKYKFTIAGCSAGWSINDKSGSCSASGSIGTPQPSTSSTQYLAFQIFTPTDDVMERRNFPSPQKDIENTVDDIIRAIGAVGSGNRKLGFIPGPLSFSHTDDQIRQLIRDSFSIALEKNIAVGFHIDDSMFWERLSSLNKTENIEWLDWNKTPNTGRRLDWSSTPTKIMPQICFNSPAVKEEVKQRAALIGQEVSQGMMKLKAAGKEYLFLGVIAGWETQIDRDFDTGKYLGYCALANEGFNAANPPQDIDEARADIVKEFIDFWAKSLSDGGVPDDKIFSHTAFLPKSTFDAIKLVNPGQLPGTYLETINFTPPRVSFGPHRRAGFSTYPQPGFFEQLQAERAKHGNPPWASSEGAAISPDAAEQGEAGGSMETYLGNLFNHGAVLVDIFGWGIGSSSNPFRKAAENKDAIKTYQKFLRGGKLIEK